MPSTSERAAGLAFLPIVATFGFYALPRQWQTHALVQFIPQISAYLCLGLWGLLNEKRIAKLGLEKHKLSLGVKYGASIGIGLGCLNTVAILIISPALGGDITFLRDTPHAHIPFWLMMPWFILFIACAVELNFRGFLLGRLLTVCTPTFRIYLPTSCCPQNIEVIVPLLLSALTFSFDPFMVTTFGALHWIAVWDGLIWGWIWIRLRNLYVVITAHAVEVIILYLTVRMTLL